MATLDAAPFRGASTRGQPCHEAALASDQAEPLPLKKCRDSILASASDLAM